ncbi:hypothetical protein SETIT_3G099000v2 [Setaria italica]|uniref:Uncharacterized protein n=1 Tax=Setaria italica TaxID=4555 RepID=K3Z8I4_SETIT|nr:uncharacterized protein LOC101778356 [Setaria italica]RCV15964.1 hypothetical protein SETIT_3G099000v2 [Setaria italica]
MQRRRSYHSLSLPVRGGEANSDANEPARAGDGTNNYDHLVDAQDFRNMRLAIGTVDRSIFEMSLSDNLTGTRHIDIRLRQNVAPGNVPGPEEQAVVEPGSGNGSRLKITVAADEPEPRPDADDKEYLDQMRGWLMTVAALFVGNAFQAAIQPPQWVQLGALQGDEPARPEDANTSASGPAAALSPSAQRRRAEIYFNCNGVALMNALSLLLVLVLLRGTSTASRVTKLIGCAMPTLFLTQALTFALATSTNWRETWIAFAKCTVYAVVVIVIMLGKLGGCIRIIPQLLRR